MADTAEGDIDIGVVEEAQTSTDAQAPATKFDTTDTDYFFSEQFLYKIGMNLGRDWTHLAYELFDGVLPQKNTTSLLDDIQRSNQASDWGPRMLIQWQWKLKQSSNPSDILRKALKTIGRNDLAEMVNSPDPKEKRYRNTFDPTVQDYVRTAEYQGIEEMLEKCNLMAVTGPTGHGKTEHVKHYVETHYGSLQRSVTWRFNANSADDVRNSITAFFESVGKQKKTPNDLKDMLRMIKNEIMEINGKHLLFFDDCAKEVCGAIRAIFFKDEKQTSSQIKVIIESHESFINLQHSVEVKGFQEEEAMTFFKTKCSSVNPRHVLSDSDSSHIRKLVELLDKSPSAISIAAYHIATQREDIEEFIKKIEGGDIAPFLQDQYLNGGHRNSLICHRIHIESIKKSDECDSYKLLQAMALMGRDPIPIIVLEHIAKRNAGNGKRPKYTAKMDSVTKLIAIMHDRSMLTLIGNGEDRSLSTHNLIQMATLSLMSDTEKAEILTLLMSALLCYFGKDIRFMDSFRINTLLLPHVIQVLKHAADCEGPIHMEIQQIVLLDTLALTETQNEAYDRAFESFKSAYKSLLNLLEIDENDAGCQKNSVSDLERFVQEKARTLFYPAFQRFSSRDDWNVEDFVANTVLNKSDKEALKDNEDGDSIASDLLNLKLVDKKSYTEFQKKRVALDLAKAKETFLMEKLAFIQYSYGRLMFYDQIRNRADFVKKKWDFYQGLLLAQAICNMIDEQLEKSTRFHIMLGMQVERSALLYIKIEKKNVLEVDGSKSEKSDDEWKKDLEDAEQKYRYMQTDNKVMIQNGLVKKKKNDHFNKVVCCRQLAKIYQKLLVLDQTNTSMREKAEDHYKKMIVEKKAGYRYPVDTFKAMERLEEVLNLVKKLDDANTSDEDKETIRQELEKIKTE